MRASRDCSNVARMISWLMPSIFRSSWMPVMPFCVPAILKSMSPKWSSSPMMSVSRTHCVSDSFTRPIEMPATGLLIGTPASIRPSVAPQTLAMLELPLRFEDVGDHADRVGELLGGRAGPASTLRSASAPWPISRRPGPRIGPHFADGERREVVVEHELLAVLVEQAVDPLLVARRAERDGDQGLRLAPLEDGRAVHPRQHIDLALDVPQRAVIAAVGPRAAEDQVADDALFQVVPGGARRPPA